MKIKYKLAIIISIQIILIIGSFGFLAYFENETSLIGNSINVAGKNRFLSMVAHDNIQDVLLGINSENPMDGFNSLESNLLFLKDGGTVDDLSLKPLDSSFLDEYEYLYAQFLEFKNAGSTILEISKTTQVPNEKILEFDQKTTEFITEADLFVDKLSVYEKIKSDRLIVIEISLMFVNIAAHLFMVYLLIILFKKESQKLVKLEKLGIIGELAARIAHDLRNPLSVLKISFELIKQDRGLSQKSIEKIPRIERAIDRMSHQIDDVMDYVRTSPLNIIKHNFNSLLKEAIEHLSIPKTIDVIYPQSDVWIYCDRRKFLILLENIIQNAINAMDKKGKISVRTETQPSNIRIIIENTGPPIPTHLIDKIFEPLFTTYEKGTGLGLATCRNIVLEHQGEIYAKNNPTCFVILLPNKN
ncbi:MAG: HAMP domain-containing sensor histidine kinase [Nitrosopumilaceae archaeon]|nr:HAMP domain-containing sensor histidine kinase [Nitrosopumilaceae archaeon]